VDIESVLCPGTGARTQRWEDNQWELTEARVQLGVQPGNRAQPTTLGATILCSLLRCETQNCPIRNLCLNIIRSFVSKGELLKHSEVLRDCLHSRGIVGVILEGKSGMHVICMLDVNGIKNSWIK
jgi:hypothetical protein